jgi:hypothetical protein
MSNKEILDNALEGAMIFSDVESVYIKWIKPQTGIFENHEGKYGILYWDEKFKEWDNVGAIYAAKLLCSSRSLADIKRIIELENALDKLIDRAQQVDSWESFPESWIDEAYKSLKEPKT